MSEFVKSLETEPIAEIIAAGLETWLKKEIGSSTTGRNHYLDEFHDFQQDLKLPYDDNRNSNAQKNRGHYNRLIEWTSALVQYYDMLEPDQREYALARQIFCAQMYLSGLYRVQCFTQASSQADYYDRRLDRNFIGIDLERTINKKLDGSTVYTIDELAKRTLSTNQSQQEHVEELHKVGRFDAGKENSQTISRIVRMQKEWVGIVVDYALFAANEHGGNLERVPFLEPKSISDDPQVYYPFSYA